MISNIDRINSRTHKVSCLIVEDEDQGRSYVRDILGEIEEFEKIFEAKDLKEAEEILTKHSPQLLILDINLPDGDSFDLLSKLKQSSPDIQYNIIFTTAHASYAVEAFKFSALDYLLKPFTPDELLSAVRKALKELGDHQYQSQLESFMYNYQEKDYSNRKIVLKSMENIHVVKVVDILQAVSDNNYTLFHLSNGEKITVSVPLKAYESKLADCGFMRVHQSHLVNLRFIKSFQKKNNLIVLENDDCIPVAQSKRSLLMTYFDSLS